MTKNVDDLVAQFKASIANAPISTAKRLPTKNELVQAAHEKFARLFDLIAKFNEVVKAKFGNKAAVQLTLNVMDTKAGILRGQIDFAKEGIGRRQIPISIQAGRIWFEDPAFHFQYQNITRRDYGVDSIDEAIEKLSAVLSNFFV
jgi:hypothetical protein